MKKVLVLGGTGLLGNKTVHELLSRGYEVKSVSLPPMPADNLFPDEVENILANINDFTDQEIEDLLSDCDGVMYAIGADERTIPKKPALKFFYEANVLPTQRLARIAAKTGVKSFVIFGSYFAEFAERLADSDLRNQPYPNTRLLQEQVGFAEGEGTMAVSSLRLPYIFGTVDGQIPLWKMFTDQIKGKEVFPAPAGGTAFLTAEQVAQAAVGALERKEHRKTYAVATDYMTYEAFYKMMVEALGQTEQTEIPVLSYEELKENYMKIDKDIEDAGLELGIKQVLSGWAESLELKIDPEETFNLLNVKEQDTQKSIEETLKKCVDAE